MKRTITIVGILFLVGWSSLSMAADHMSQNENKTMTGTGMKKMTSMPSDDHDAMEKHGQGEMTDMASDDVFTHQAVSQGIRADVKIMSLSSMSMKDPNGATHHIMIEFRDDTTDAWIKDAVGKIKVIAPDKKEQSGLLKNYSGSYAINLTFKEPGNYGVICLVLVGEKKYLYKFWYPHS